MYECSLLSLESHIVLKISVRPYLIVHRSWILRNQYQTPDIKAQY